MSVYHKAIDLLVSAELDYRKIVVELAKRHPTIFVNLATPVQAAVKEIWPNLDINFYQFNNAMLDSRFVEAKNDPFGYRHGPQGRSYRDWETDRKSVV